MLVARRSAAGAAMARLAQSDSEARGAGVQAKEQGETSRRAGSRRFGGPKARLSGEDVTGGTNQDAIRIQVACLCAGMRTTERCGTSLFSCMPAILPRYMCVRHTSSLLDVLCPTASARFGLHAQASGRWPCCQFSTCSRTM
jgi:hypothetical protein